MIRFLILSYAPDFMNETTSARRHKYSLVGMPPKLLPSDALLKVLEIFLLAPITSRISRIIRNGFPSLEVFNYFWFYFFLHLSASFRQAGLYPAVDCYLSFFIKIPGNNGTLHWCLRDRPTLRKQTLQKKNKTKLYTH